MTKTIGEIMEWISVKDGLPEVGVRVLIYAERKDRKVYCHSIVFGRLAEKKEPINLNLLLWFYIQQRSGERPTHWMPLPPPPKEK